MFEERTDQRFQTTSQTLIDAMRSGGDAARREALEQLVRVYWGPIYAFIRRKGHKREDALDLTQAFFTEKIVERDLFAGVDRGRGRLRSLLCRAVSNFLVDQHRRGQARGSEVRVFMYDVEREEALLESQGEDPDCERIFDRRWALATLDEAIRRCECHFKQGDRRAHWLAFERRILQPAWTNRDAPKYAELARDLGFSTLAHTRAAVHVV